MSCSCVCGPFDSQQGKFSLPSSWRSELEVLSAGRTLRVVGKTIFCVSHLIDTIMHLLTVSSKVLVIIWYGAQAFVGEEKCNLIKFNNLRQPNVKKLWGLNAFFYFKVLMYCIWILAMPEFNVVFLFFGFFFFFFFFNHMMTFYLALILFQKAQLFLILFYLY